MGVTYRGGNYLLPVSEVISGMNEYNIIIISGAASYS